MGSALYLKFRGFTRTYPRRYEAAPDGFAQVAKVVQGESAVLGRSEEANVIYRTRDVSRRHCVVDGTTEPFTITDLKSTSGTRLNGRMLKRTAPLSAGDEIGIGQVLILVHEHPPPSERSTLQGWMDELDKSSRDRRWAAVEAIASLGTDARDAVGPVIRACADPHAPVRRYAARALGSIGDAASVDVLIERLHEEDDSLVALEVVRALGRFEERAEGAIVALVALLSDGRLQIAASRTLARIGAPAVAELRGVLGDDDPEAVRLAVQALADVGEAAASSVDELNQLAHHEDPEVRRDVLRAISKMGRAASATVQTLFEVIDRDDDERVRAWATSALGAAARNTRWEAKAVAELTRALEDPALRFSAIVALGQMGPAARVAITPLKRIAGGARELYAKAAEEALESVDVDHAAP